VSQPPTWWEGLYATSDVSSLPWYTPVLDKDFERALRQHSLEGKRILDLGTGPATHAINLAKRGFEVIATDISPSAIEKAKAAANAADVKIDFRVDDILHSELRANLVDVIVDRGVFHVLPPDQRPVYVDTVYRILRPRGWLLLKCFSDKEPGTYGPYRIAAKELRNYFREKFEVVSVVDTVFNGTLKPHPKALFATFRRP
jgi:cyclopropane fatty-acyl-phospholipid synthase-like methyltransferase